MTTITAPDTITARTEGDRFVSIALFVLAAVFVALQILAGQVTPFWGTPAAVYIVLGLALLWRAPRWLLIVTAVVVLLQVVTSAPFMIPGLTHPETPASFLPDVFIIVASFTVVTGAVAAVRRSEPTRRPIALVAGAVAGAAVVLSIGATAGVASDTREAGDVAVTAADVEYPERVVVNSGAALWIDNEDPFRHTFVVEGTDVRAELPGATAVRVEADLAPGTYTFFCDVPGHEETMRGTLSVE